MKLLQRHLWLSKELSDRLDDWCQKTDDNFSRFTRIALRAALSEAERIEKSRTSQTSIPNSSQTSPEPILDVPTKKDEQDIIPTPTQELHHCSAPRCVNEATGKFKLTSPDLESKELYLCNFHLNIAKREGEVSEV